jgi:hypothetical protein
LLWALGAFCSCQLVAATVDFPDTDQGVTPLGERMEFLLDPDGRMGYAEARRATGFAPAAGSTPSFGFLSGALWGRCVLRNTSVQTQKLVVELEMSQLSHLEWFVQSGVGESRRSSGGARDPGLHPYRFPFTALSLAPGESVTVYCRIRSDAAVWLPFVAGTEAALWQHRFTRDAIDYIYFGLGLALSGLGFGLTLIYRRRVFLFAALLPLALIGYYCLLFGYYHHLPWAWPAWVGREGVLIADAAVVGYFLLFMRSFFGTQTETRMAKLLLGVGLLLPGVTVVLTLALPFKVASYLCHGAVVTAYLLVTTQMFTVAWRQRLVDGALLAGACLVALMGKVFLVLQWAVVIPMLVPPMEVLRLASIIIFVLPLLACVFAQRSELLLEVRLAAAQRATAAAEATQLRAQLNPHFLLNTLNSIDTLSHDDPGKIPALVQRLAFFLRRCLLPTATVHPTLGEELGAIRNYLEIEQVRYGDRLQVAFEVAAEVAALRLPEFLLQPLVENALKFGLKEQATLQVRLGADVVAKTLRVWVENQGRLAPPEPARRYPGLGVDNVRLRLKLIYGERATFGLREVDGWVRAEIQLPLA